VSLKTVPGLGPVNVSLEKGLAGRHAQAGNIATLKQLQNAIAKKWLHHEAV
jgi:hypothetical protein